jgi:hypothetical protein
MSKTWYILNVICPHCGYNWNIKVGKNYPPLCDKIHGGCGRQMNINSEDTDWQKEEK